jgi:hypothetical protein
MADESGLIRNRRYIVWDAEKASLNKLLLLLLLRFRTNQYETIFTNISFPRWPIAVSWRKITEPFVAVVLFKLGYYRSRHQIACFKATEGLHSSLPRGSKSPVQRCQLCYTAGSSCIHSPALRCSCCNVIRFCCDLEACNLVTAAIVILIY